MLKMLFGYLVMIGFTVLGNLLLKQGASAYGRHGDSLLALVNGYTVAGLLSFATAMCSYMLILTKLPLNVAQSFAAAQFVAVILASYFLLGEPIDGLRWAGIAMITFGILLVGRSVT
jgi:drug/metabolite transporter (DMT)-like permease